MRRAKASVDDVAKLQAANLEYIDRKFRITYAIMGAFHGLVLGAIWFVGWYFAG